MVRIALSLVSLALAEPSILSDTASLLQVKAPNNYDAALWKNGRHPGDGSKKKGHFLDAAFLEYQFAEEMVDEAVEARDVVQEVLYQLRQDVEFETENLQMKEKVVAMWGGRIDQFKNIYERTSARGERSLAALENKKTILYELRSQLMSMRDGATPATAEQDMKTAERKVAAIQKVQAEVDEMQTSFRADRAEQHTVKMNLKRCQGYKQEAVDGVVQQQKFVSDLTREYSEGNAPAMLAVQAAKDVEIKAKKNVEHVRNRLWSTWRKLRREDISTKKQAVVAKKQARRATKKRRNSAAQDKKQAVAKIQQKTKQIVREGVRDARTIRNGR